MFKRIIFILLFLYNVSVFAKDCIECMSPPPPGPNAKSFSRMEKDMHAILNASLNVDNAKQFLATALNYLNGIKNSKDFNESLVEAYVRRLKEITNNKTLPMPVRARAELINSGMVGKLAEKRQSPAMGKESFYMLKGSMAKDPNLTDAKLAYVTAITEITKKSFLIRKVVESTLEINLKNESAAAIRIIEQQKWLGNADTKKMYLQLKNFIS